MAAPSTGRRARYMIWNDRVSLLRSSYPGCSLGGGENCNRTLLGASQKASAEREVFLCTHPTELLRIIVAASKGCILPPRVILPIRWGELRAMTGNEEHASRRMRDVPVLIVGAGPTGLVLALWLTRLGVAVRIIDKTSEPGTTSRALAVSARTLELYRQFGMADPLLNGGVKVPGANFWVQGAKIARLPLDRLGMGLTPFPFALIFPQDAHERVLVERLESLGVTVERRTELTRFDLKDDGCERRSSEPTARRRPAKRPILRAATGRVRS